MTAEITPVEGCRSKVHVELPADDVAVVYKEILARYRREASIPGFRKGKAPVSAIERLFASSLEQDLSQRAVQKAWNDVVREKELKVVHLVDIENVSVARATGLSADFTYDAEPEFSLPAYDAIPVSFEKDSVTDAQVEERLEGLRRSSASYKDADAAHAIVDGDLVQGSLTGSADGGPIDDLVGEEHKSLASTDSAWCRAGAEYGAIPGFGLAVVGLHIGDSVAFDAVFPDDFHVEALRGKTVHYEGKVAKVSTTVLPEVDADFCKRFGANDADALRDLLRKRLEMQAEAVNASRKREAICHYLLANTAFEPPKSIVEAETRGIVQDMISSGVQNGVNKEDILKDKEKILADAERLANDRVRVQFILRSIADAEKITAPRGEVLSRVRDIATRRGETFDKTLADLKRRGAMDDIEHSVLSDKTLAWLAERAKEN